MPSSAKESSIETPLAPRRSRWSQLFTAILWLRDLTLRRHPLFWWSINAAALLLLAGWIIWDARFSSTWDQLEYEFGLAPDTSKLDEFASTFLLQWKIYLLAGSLIVATVSLVLMTIGLTMGARGHRALSSWMVALSLGCCWLGLATGWSEMVWVGKRLRIDSHVAAFQDVTQSLKNDWPDQDGERPPLGPFMAYPAGKAKTLILLTTPELEQHGLTFSSIERSDHGGIRYQLSGNERGVWLEWHPDGQEPASFVGGLLEPHYLQRSVSLGDGWFLTRYEQAEAAS
ncbi:hypothetical protein [Blastopirellula marina]|uniref:Uncharacterized protein n=1 Tax=Blastopirellula marina TaxID=124 RepID=A0A2S8GCV2_9BACT|nr:hypothetical protein [Blastopirellula marina]PQO42130.1 hypothetical protein C5Y93_27675 [Blastopirellula marina]